MVKLFLISIFFVASLGAQSNNVVYRQFVRVFEGLPFGDCTQSRLGIDDTTGVPYVCHNGVWLTMISVLVQPGTITLITSGACPAGFAEATDLDGLTVIGTTSAHGDVGTTGGTNTIVPTGAVSAPVFTGALLPSHTHSFVGNSVAAASSTPTPKLAGTVSGPNGLTLVTTATGVNGTASAGVPAGTNSVPVFAGNSFDNRSAYKKVIFCRKQ